MKDVAVKRLGVMSEALDLIFENGRKEVCKVSSVKYLQKSHGKCRTYDKKRKHDDLVRLPRDRPINELRGFYQTSKEDP